MQVNGKGMSSDQKWYAGKKENLLIYLLLLYLSNIFYMEIEDEF